MRLPRVFSCVFCCLGRSCGLWSGLELVDWRGGALLALLDSDLLHIRMLRWKT